MINAELSMPPLGDIGSERASGQCECRCPRAVGGEAGNSATGGVAADPFLIPAAHAADRFVTRESRIRYLIISCIVSVEIDGTAVAVPASDESSKS